MRNKKIKKLNASDYKILKKIINLTFENEKIKNIYIQILKLKIELVWMLYPI
jgi:hypothetical protein